MRVVIGEDTVLLRAGVARLLEDAGMEVVGQAADAEDLLRKVRAHKPDVAIVDIRMPPGNADDGLRAAREMRSRAARRSACSCSRSTPRSTTSTQLLEDGAEGVGYLLKERIADVDRFVDSVRRVAEGGSALDPEIVALMMGRREGGPLDSLTEREREVLGLMAEGKTNRGIAGELFVSRARGRAPRDRDLRQARAAVGRRPTTAGCSRCSPTWTTTEARAAARRTRPRPPPAAPGSRRQLRPVHASVDPSPRTSTPTARARAGRTARRGRRPAGRARSRAGRPGSVPRRVVATSGRSAASSAVERRVARRRGARVATLRAVRGWSASRRRSRGIYAAKARSAQSSSTGPSWHSRSCVETWLKSRCAPYVVGRHGRRQVADAAVARRQSREVAEQRADAAPLEVVPHRHGDLRAPAGWSTERTSRATATSSFGASPRSAT